MKEKRMRDRMREKKKTENHGQESETSHKLQQPTLRQASCSRARVTCMPALHTTTHDIRRCSAWPMARGRPLSAQGSSFSSTSSWSCKSREHVVILKELYLGRDIGLPGEKMYALCRPRDMLGRAVLTMGEVLQPFVRLGRR